MCVLAQNSSYENFKKSDNWFMYLSFIWNKMNHLSLCAVHTFVINLGDLKLFVASHQIKQSFISTCSLLFVIETMKLSIDPSFGLLHSFTLFQKNTKQIITIIFIWHIIAFNYSTNFVVKERLNRSTQPLCSLIVETSLKEIIKVAMLVETIKFKLNVHLLI
mgnify:CR=1 FL=1